MGSHRSNETLHRTRCPGRSSTCTASQNAEKVSAPASGSEVDGGEARRRWPCSFSSCLTFASTLRVNRSLRQLELADEFDGGRNSVNLGWVVGCLDELGEFGQAAPQESTPGLLPVVALLSNPRGVERPKLLVLPQVLAVTLDGTKADAVQLDGGTVARNVGRQEHLGGEAMVKAGQPALYLDGCAPLRSFVSV